MKRFLKIVLILALFTVAIAYVLFRVLFFDPFGGTRAEFDAMIPSDVDLMLRRRDLEKDFEPFPMPRFFLSLKVKDEWEALVGTRLYHEYEPKLGIERAFDQLQRAVAQTGPIDPMQDVAGREVMVLGKWKPDGTLALAAIARGSFRAKLFSEAVKIGAARKVAGDLIKDYSEQGGVRSMTVQQPGQPPQKVHLARSDDALIVGNDGDFVRSIVALDENGANSLDKSPEYRAAILGPTPVGRPIDFVVDVADFCKHLGIVWPPAAPDEPPGMRFARELLAPERYGMAMGRLQLGNQIEAAVTVPVDRAAVKPVAAGLLDGTSDKLSVMHEFCGKVFPAKVAVCGYLRVGVKDLFRRAESLLAQEERQLLNDFVANLRSNDQGFQYKSTVELLDAFASLIADEMAFAIEPGEAYHVPGTPEGEMEFHDPHWGPRVALVFPIANKDGATQFVTRLVSALSARQSAIRNVWKWAYGEGRPEFREIKTVDNDQPTVSIGILSLQKRDCIVITKTGAFLDEIVKQKLAVEENGSPAGLQSELQFRQAAEAMEGYGQGFVFASSANLEKVLSDYCVVWAEQLTRPDWVALRQDIERQVVAKSHPEYVNRHLDEVIRRKIDPEVDAQIDQREQNWKEVVLPRKTDELTGDLEALKMFRWLAITLGVTERDVQLKLRLASPINFTTDDLGG